MPRLIVNADDFGLSRGVNRAIAEAHTAGVVTSATLMANGPAFDDAVKTARALPNLAIGCHVVLVDGIPVSDAASLPTLTTSSAGGARRLHHSLAVIARMALTNRLRAEEIESESIAQIRKLQAAGITVSHLDTHKHTHLFPAILQPLLRAARACGVPAFRNPIEPPSTLSHHRGSSLWKRRMQVAILRRVAAGFPVRVRDAGLLTTDGTLGITVTGALTQDLVCEILQSRTSGTWEFVCHPGYDDQDLRSTGTRLLQSRVDELRILTSGITKQLVADRAFELISYRDLASQPVSGRAPAARGSNP